MSASAVYDPERLDMIFKKYEGGDASSLIHVLQDVQNEFNHLPRDAMESVSSFLKVPLGRVFSVATFYKAFSLKPRGKTIVKVCQGTSCHIRGSTLIIDDLKEGFGAGPGETTEDMKFTIESVNCVGACALAPVVVADRKYIANVKPGTIVKSLNEL